MSSALSKLVNSTKTAIGNFASSFGNKNDRFVAKAAAVATGGFGALCALVMTVAYLPLPVVCGLFGAYALARGDWNGGFLSRTASACAGFVLGFVAGPAILGAKMGAGVGLKVGRFVGAHMPSSQPRLNINQKGYVAPQTAQAPQAPQNSTFTGAGMSQSFHRAVKGETLMIGNSSPKGPQLPVPTQPKN